MELKALAMELRFNELGERKREGRVGFKFMIDQKCIDPFGKLIN